MPIRVNRANFTKVTDDPSSSVVRFQSAQTVNLDIFNELGVAKVRLPAASAGPPLVPSTHVVDLSMFSTIAGDEPRGFVFEFDRSCELDLNFNDADGVRTIPCVLPGAVGTIGRVEMDCSPTAITIRNADSGGVLNVTLGIWGAETPA